MHGKDRNPKIPTMTHQHFRYIARIVRDVRETSPFPAEREAARRMMFVLARDLGRTNPAFDSERFKDACGGDVVDVAQ
jgi:hypothetical protein